MKPECSSVSKEEKKESGRLSLQVLQPEATYKENLVGGSRQPVTNMRGGLKSRDKIKNDKNNEKTANEKTSEQSKVKENLKKKKLVHKSVQTEDEKQITAEDLTSEEPSKLYWKTLAEKRRAALDESLEENRTLHEKLELLEEEKKVTDEMLEESRTLVELLKEMIAEGEDEDEVRTDSEEESFSSSS